MYAAFDVVVGFLCGMGFGISVTFIVQRWMLARVQRRVDEEVMRIIRDR